MFVNNEITERGQLHRLLKRIAAEVTMDERAVWARSVERTVEDAARSSVPLRNRVARPVVVLTAAPALTAVAAALRSEDIAVPRAALDAVREFMTNGIDSPLYGHDPLAARRGAESLRRLLLGDEVAQSATEAAQIANAA